jgi:hypothetical protein
MRANLAQRGQNAGFQKSLLTCRGELPIVFAFSKINPIPA